MAFPWETGSGDNGINPTTGLPWDVYPDKASPTGYTHVPSGTHVYKDGSPYTGVTGSGVTVNVAAPVTWGPTQVDVDGSVTGAPGSTYQVNSRGDVSILTRGKAAAGDDGINDTTGLPNGVYPDKNSSTGYAYYGSGTPIPVQKDGADARPMGATYSGGDGGSGAPTLVNGKYTWDPVAKKFVVAPGMESTGSSSVSVSTPRVSSGSSGGGGGGSSASSLSDQLSLISARASSEMDVAKYKNDLEYAYLMAKLALENDPSSINNRIQLAQLELQVQQFNESVGQRNADRRVQLIKDYESAVSSPDLARLQARRMAIGGDATTASLLRDGANYRDNASAAALLAEIRGLAGSGNALGQIAASGLGIPAGTGAGGGMPTTPGVPGTGGLPAASVPGTGTAAGTGTPAANASGTDAGEGMWGVAKAITQAQLEEQRAYEAYHNPANWTLVPSQNLTYGGAGTGDRYTNNLTGERITAEQYAYLMASNGPQSEAEMMMGALQDAEILRGQQPGAALDPNARLPFTQKTATGSGGTTLYNMPWGWSTTNQMPSSTWQTGGDRGDLSRVITTDSRPATAGPGGTVLAQEPVTNVLPQATLPMFARGNMRPFPGAHIAGDPAVAGRPNPEVVQWTPRGNIVMPMSRMPQRTQQMAWRAMPKFAEGTDSTWGFPQVQEPQQQEQYPAYGGWGEAAATSGFGWGASAPVGGQPLATQPVAATAPMMDAHAPVVAPALPMAPMPAPVVTSPVATTVGSAPSPTTPDVVPSTTTVPTVGSTTTTATAGATQTAEELYAEYQAYVKASGFGTASGPGQPIGNNMVGYDDWLKYVKNQQPSTKYPTAGITSTAQSDRTPAANASGTDAASTTTTATVPATTPTTTATVGGDTVPTTTEYDPLHPLAITPEAQGLMDEIDDFRDTFEFPDANTLDVAFLRAAPSYQKSALLGKQTRYGIPIEDWQAEMAKYYLAGRPRFAGVVGY